MPHDVELIILLAVGFGLALVFGYLAARLRLPPLIGYLIAGILISPHTPGVVGDIHLANQLAELRRHVPDVWCRNAFFPERSDAGTPDCPAWCDFTDCSCHLARGRSFDAVGLELWLSAGLRPKPVLCQYRGSTQSPW